jgi:hypothetical protein
LGEETFVVTHVVEVPAVGEHDSIEWVHRDEVEVVSAVLAEELEQLVEEMGSGDAVTAWPMARSRAAAARPPKPAPITTARLLMTGSSQLVERRQHPLHQLTRDSVDLARRR